MTREISFSMTSLAESKNKVKALPFSPAAEAASPTSIETTIRASILFLDKSMGKSGTVKARTNCCAALKVASSGAAGMAI